MTDTELTLEQLQAVAGGLLFADFDHFQLPLNIDTGDHHDVVNQKDSGTFGYYAGGGGGR